MGMGIIMESSTASHSAGLLTLVAFKYGSLARKSGQPIPPPDALLSERAGLIRGLLTIGFPS